MSLLGYSQQLQSIASCVTLARVRIELRADEEAILPSYLGSTLRGAISRTLKRIACTEKERECLDCPSKNQCSYSILFETGPIESVGKWLNRTSWPRPIIVQPPPVQRRKWKPGQILNFDIVLFGQAIEAFIYLKHALLHAARQGLGKDKKQFFLRRILDQAPNCQDRTLYNAMRGNFPSKLPTAFSPTLPSGYNQMPGSTVTLVFLTPARIFEQGKLVKTLSFHSLIKSLLGRISSISQFHCGKSIDVDYKGILKAASHIQVADNKLRIAILSRYSSTQKRKLPLDGLVGAVTFKGDDLKSFLPLLHTGQFVHVGKATVMGLGRYKIELPKNLDSKAQ